MFVHFAPEKSESTFTGLKTTPAAGFKETNLPLKMKCYNGVKNDCWNFRELFYMCEGHNISI